jgi:hypothetical protein
VDLSSTPDLRRILRWILKESLAHARLIFWLLIGCRLSLVLPAVSLLFPVDQDFWGANFQVQSLIYQSCQGNSTNTKSLGWKKRLVQTSGFPGEQGTRVTQDRESRHLVYYTNSTSLEHSRLDSPLSLPSFYLFC